MFFVSKMLQIRSDMYLDGIRFFIQVIELSVMVYSHPQKYTYLNDQNSIPYHVVSGFSSCIHFVRKNRKKP